MDVSGYNWTFLKIQQKPIANIDNIVRQLHYCPIHPISSIICIVQPISLYTSTSPKTSRFFPQWGPSLTVNSYSTVTFPRLFRYFYTTNYSMLYKSIVNYIMEQNRFHLNWIKAYSKIISPQQSQQITGFGLRECFAYRWVGRYAIVRNLSMGGKRPSGWVKKAYELRSIAFAFDDKQFNFNKINGQETLCLIDLEQNMVDYELKENQTGFKHKVIINGTPCCYGHSLFLPYFAQNLPQQLTQDVVLQAIRLKKLLPQFKITFNSQGSASSVNHLHFHLIESERLIGQNSFPIDDFQISGRANKIDIDSKGVKIMFGQQLGGLYVRLTTLKQPIYDQSICGLLTSLLQGLVSLAFKHSLPHNLMVLNENTILLVFRNFATEEVPFGYIQYSGIMLAKKEDQFQAISEEAIIQKFKTIQLDNAFILRLQKEVGQVFEDLIE